MFFTFLYAQSKCPEVSYLHCPHHTAVSSPGNEEEEERLWQKPQGAFLEGKAHCNAWGCLMVPMEARGMGSGPHSAMCVWASSLGFRLLSCKRGVIRNTFLRPVVRMGIAKLDEMLEQ